MMMDDVMPTRTNRTMDLVEVLRTIPRSSLPIGVAWNKCEEAADEIERLRSESERLRKFSLKAFTVVESIVGEGHLLMYPAYDADDVFMEGCDLLGVEDAETARAALKAEAPNE
jgi:hypothetical protein